MKRSPSSPDQDIIRILEELRPKRSSYPADLLAARRAAFMEQVAKHSQQNLHEGSNPRDHSVIEYLRGLQSLQNEYPLKLWLARRTAFQCQIARMTQAQAGWRHVLASVFYKWFGYPGTSRSSNMLRTAIVVAVVAIAAFVGLQLQDRHIESAGVAPLPDGVSRVVSVATTVTPVERTTCKSGYEPPLCLAREFDKSHDLTFPGNGSARPAVAKDTIPGYDEIHQAAHVNDGQYGPGASWVSVSPHSWIKIDLGKPTAINTVAFGRDRIGNLNDGDPGRFVIAVALSDDIYADGNSSNDDREYSAVYDSEEAGFSGYVSGAETVHAHFDSLVARYIKITFENPGTAIDEVEVYMLQPGPAGDPMTRTPGDRVPRNTPTATLASTVVPTQTATLIPTETPSSTPLPTNTPIPTDTATLVPTHTPVPTNTPVPPEPTEPIPTDPPMPTDPPEPMPIDPMPTAPPLPIETPDLFIALPDVRQVILPPVNDKSKVPSLEGGSAPLPNPNSTISVLK